MQKSQQQYHYQKGQQSNASCKQGSGLNSPLTKFLQPRRSQANSSYQQNQPAGLIQGKQSKHVSQFPDLSKHSLGSIRKTATLKDAIPFRQQTLNQQNMLRAQ